MRRRIDRCPECGHHIAAHGNLGCNNRAIETYEKCGCMRDREEAAHGLAQK